MSYLIFLDSGGKMNIQLTQLTPTHWFIIILLWLSFGMVLDVLKLLVGAAGSTTSKASHTLKHVSNLGRVNIIKVDPRGIELAVLKDISKVFGRIKCSLLYWSNNLLYQVIESESQASTEITPTLPLEEEQHVKSYLVPCENSVISIFNRSSENKYAGQQIIGALIGFVALLAFLYADAAQGAQTYSLLFDEDIPQFLNSIILPLVMASAGTAVILGLFIGDMLGLTHLGLFKQNTPRYFLWIMCLNLIVSLTLSTIIALARRELLDITATGARPWINVAQSVVILPMLVTTFLLFRGISGIYVVLSFILAIFALPFGVFEFFVRVSADLVRLGVIGGTLLFTRITWLAVGALELLFGLLELVVNGSFAVLTYIFAGLFFIPYLIFRITLRVLKQDDFYAEFLDNLTKNKLRPQLVENTVVLLEPSSPEVEEDAIHVKANGKKVIDL
jgi:hypothetical protein